MQDELVFEIALNDEGRRQVPRLFARAKFIFIASIIWSAITILTTAGSIVAFSTRPTGFMNQWISSRLLVACIYTISHVILFPLQAYYLFCFSRRMRESVEEQDPSKFNSRFRLLTTNATLCIVSLMVSIAYALFNVLSSFLFTRFGF